jgi:alpha-D-ribose 1-methylphosphonate 5-triphosphate synthase subunit PhnG
MLGMKRARRTRILARTRTDLPERLAASIEGRYPVEEISAPEGALVMVKKRESARGVLFYLGELLVTEAKVRIGEAVGIGIVAGYAYREARRMAVIDAAFNAELPETEGWASLLVDEEAAIAAADEAEGRRVARSRVSFESMDREAPR